jgi:hypothetical protein
MRFLPSTSHLLRNSGENAFGKLLNPEACVMRRYARLHNLEHVDFASHNVGVTLNKSPQAKHAFLIFIWRNASWHVGEQKALAPRR